MDKGMESTCSFVFRDHGDDGLVDERKICEGCSLDRDEADASKDAVAILQKPRHQGG